MVGSRNEISANNIYILPTNLLTFYLIIFYLVFVSSAHATLIGRGNGLIFDTGLNLTWLQDTNYSKTSGYDSNGLMSWEDTNIWAVTLSYAGFDNWRLPKIGQSIYNPKLRGYIWIISNTVL